jgi:HlyD family secretion protein
MDTTTVGSAPVRSLRRVFLWSLGVAVLLAAAAYGIWWWKFHDTLRYITARVTRGDIRRSINMTGSLNPVVTAQVGSFVSGNIKSWSCDYNTEVKIGQQCALIDPLPFQVVVDEDAADVRTAKAQLVKDKAAEANARIVYERDKKMREQGIVSQETLDADKSTEDQDVATIDLDIATIASKQAILHAAQVNLDYTNIVSPVNGTVITRYIDVGYTVVSNLQSSTLFLIGKDMRSMQVDTNVSEADVGEVRDGQRATFTVQAYPNRTFEAKVRQVRKGPITVQNVVTYDVVLDVDNKDLALLPGMTSDTHIITAERKNVLRVPLPATRFVPEGMARGGRGGREGAGGQAPGEGAGAGEGAVAGEAPRGGDRPGAGAGEGVGARGGPASTAQAAGTGQTNDGLAGSATGGPGAGAGNGSNAASGPSGGAGGAGNTPGAPGSGKSGSGSGGSASGASGSSGDNNQQHHHRWNQNGPGGLTANADSPGGVNGPGNGRGGAADAGPRGGAGGNGPGRRARGPRGVAHLWVMRAGKLTPVTVQTGLDDGTLIEVWSNDLKEGDEVVVNAVRPNAPKPAAGDRTPGAGNQGQANGGRGAPGGGGPGFRL